MSDLEERSFTNLVRVYEEELHHVLDGTLAMAVFTDHERQGLRYKGVLTLGRGWIQPQLTERALQVIKGKAW